MKYIFKIFCALLTCIIISIGHSFLASTYNFYSLTFWVVIPLGGLLVGFASLSGYYAGNWLLKTKPNGKDLLILFVLSVIGIGAFYYTDYFVNVVYGAAETSVSFKDYMTFILENSTSTTYVKHFKIHESSTPSFIGNCFHEVVSIIGYLVGAISVYGVLLSSNFCNKCNLRLSSADKKTLFFNDVEAFINDFVTLNRNANTIDKHFINQIFNTTSEIITKQDALKIEWHIKKCNGCNTQFLIGQMYVYDGSAWQAADYKFKTFMSEVLAEDAKKWFIENSNDLQIEVSTGGH